VRYLIPVTSFLLVFAEAPTTSSRRPAGTLHRRRARRLARRLGGACLAALHRLLQRAGRGPANGLYYLQDSNLDWGQDLKRLARYQEENRIPELVLGYWGPGQPEYYGIRWRPWTLEETVADPRRRACTPSA